MDFPRDCKSAAEYLQECLIDAEAEAANLNKIRARFERMRADLLLLAHDDCQRARVNEAVSALLEYFTRGNIVPTKRQKVLDALDGLRNVEHGKQAP